MSMHLNASVASADPAVTPSSIAGVLLMMLVVCSICGEFSKDLVPAYHPVMFLAAGVFAWSAAVLLFSSLRRVQQLQISLFLLIGAALLLYAATQGVSISIPQALARNASLLSMLLSVGFLKLVLLADSDVNQPPPVGRRAYLHTLLAVGLFGSIINISAPIIIGDRLVLRGPMDLFTARSITRVFSACAAWSPFFAGMAVVLTYVTDVRLLPLVLGGLPFMLLSLLLVYTRAVFAEGDKVDRFAGYPMQAGSLMVPLLLAAAVMLATALYPSLSILTVIAVSALLLSVTLLLRQGLRVAIARIIEYIRLSMPRAVNEVWLFLAAGVLASGLVAVLQTSEIALPAVSYSVAVASAVLALMIFVAALGIHPVIQISALTPLLLITDPQPELLAMTYLFAWSLGTLASPLSGTHLVFQGRFGIPAWRGAMQNWRYVMLMYLLAVGLLQSFSYFLPVLLSW